MNRSRRKNQQGCYMDHMRLDHATLNTGDLDASITFYRYFLNLSPGWRPDFEFPGAWLYPTDGDYAILHLIEDSKAATTGSFNHLAFRGVGVHAYIEKLRTTNGWFRAVPVPGTAFTQVHHYDPNGVKIEVIFQECLGCDEITGGAEHV